MSTADELTIAVEVKSWLNLGVLAVSAADVDGKLAVELASDVVVGIIAIGSVVVCRLFVVGTVSVVRCRVVVGDNVVQVSKHSED